MRRGHVVHRSAGAWTPTIHRLLDHLHAQGVTWLPRPLGLDEQGREVLTYLPGTVPSYPMPAWVWSEEVLVEAGRRLAQVHQASAGFDTTSPGPRVWDLAYLAYRLVPLSQAEDTGAGRPSLPVRGHRLELLCRAYAGAGDRAAVGGHHVACTTVARLLEDLAAFTAARAAAGATQVAAHVQAYRNDARWMGQHLKDLAPSGGMAPKQQLGL